MAIDQMLRYRIPASITLAQGLIESGAGTSYLARTANNHFGIKTGGVWSGPYVLRTDDAPNEQFRKYRSVAESYEDHSLFLSKRGRYSSLFFLPMTDYAAWARGLKAAGYATNPRYADMLIGVIEKYQLSQYDYYGEVNFQQNLRSHNAPFKEAYASHRRLYLCNDLVYTIAQAGDSYEQIAHDLEMKASRLRKYNEVPHDYSPREGDIIFLTKKKKHVAKSIRQTYHIVNAGESLYEISQRYGIRLEWLYRWNKLPATYSVQIGDALLLE